MITVARPTRADSVSTPKGTAQWEGHAFGAIVLAAFLLYGVGSAFASEPVGLILVGLNSAAVVGAGIIGLRLLRSSRPRTGLGYVAARIAEGALLGGGIVLTEFADAPGAGDAAYQLAMLVLGIGSVPFCHALGRERAMPQRLALWGMAGYVALATGALLELVTGRTLAIAFAIPGGVFELTIGLLLLQRGFGFSLRRSQAPTTAHPYRDTDNG